MRWLFLAGRRVYRIAMMPDDVMGMACQRELREVAQFPQLLDGQELTSAFYKKAPSPRS